MDLSTDTTPIRYGLFLVYVFLFLQLDRGFLVLAVFLFYTAYTEAAQANAKITFVPGYSGYHPSDHYGGHDTIFPTG